jgi:hypothetical protein
LVAYRSYFALLAELECRLRLLWMCICLKARCINTVRLIFGIFVEKYSAPIVGKVTVPRIANWPNFTGQTKTESGGIISENLLANFWENLEHRVIHKINLIVNFCRNVGKFAQKPHIETVEPERMRSAFEILEFVQFYWVFCIVFYIFTQNFRTRCK